MVIQLLMCTAAISWRLRRTTWTQQYTCHTGCCHRKTLIFFSTGSAIISCPEATPARWLISFQMLESNRSVHHRL